MKKFSISLLSLLFVASLALLGCKEKAGEGNAMSSSSSSDGSACEQLFDVMGKKCAEQGAPPEAAKKMFIEKVCGIVPADQAAKALKAAQGADDCKSAQEAIKALKS